MYFSEELKNAEKFGYKVFVKKGYLFDKYNIFEEFISELYKIKESHKKEDPWYAISKLLMNSLYGRFGMDPDFETFLIIDSEELDNYLNKFEVKDFKELNNNKILISYLDKNKIENSKFKTAKSNKNVSISIPSAITAYARIFMSQYKNNIFKIYYTDTDSLFIDKPLDSNLISNKLGHFKLENVFKKAVFLAPKVYGGVTDKGEEITKIKGYKNKISFNFN